MTTTLAEQEREHIFYASFVNMDGTEATLVGLPTIEIRSLKNNTPTTILTASNMTQITGSLYYYKYFIGKINVGDYAAVYRATYSDTSHVVFEESLTVCSKDFFQRIKGAGIYKTTTHSPSDKVIKSLTEEITALEKIIKDIQSKMDLGSSPIMKDIKPEFENQTVALSVLKAELEDLKSKMNLTTSSLSDVSTKLSSIDSLVSKTYVKSLTDEELEEVAKNGY